MSMTFTLTGNTSVLSADFYPAIPLQEGDYYLGLIDFEAFNSIPNVDETNNLFYYGTEKLEIPTGSYEVEDLEKFLRSKLGDRVISLAGNNNTLRCEIKCTHEIDFTQANTIGPMLGFSSKKLAANTLHESDLPVNIMRVETIIVECNIIHGAYINGAENHILYQCGIFTWPGYKIVEVPHNITYLRVIPRANIDNITLKFTDQNGRLINFRGENITVRLHLKHGLSV